AATNNVSFQAQTGSLILDHSAGFAAAIIGFAGDGTLANSDQIDLKDINYGSSSFSESFDAASDTLTVSDGTNSAALHCVGSYVAQNFSFTSDGGSGTIVYDPPVPQGSSNGAEGPNTSGPGGGVGLDSFKFIDDGLTGPHPNDLPHPDHGLMPWAASQNPSAHEGVETSSQDAHDVVSENPASHTDQNFAHFHLV